MKEYPGVRKNIATSKNWKEKCTHLASTHFWEEYLATTHFWEKYVTNLFPAPMWSKENLIAWTTEEIYTANLASCSGNWRKIGPKSQQYKIWFLQGCSRLEVKSGNLMSGSSPSPWTSVNSADFLCINCAPEVRVWQVQIQLIFHSQNIQWCHFKRDCLSSLISTSCWNWVGTSWTKH